MYYGAVAGADDVVGHEMTHGVTERNSDLFYWGQSGAINESLADIMGEIVDHRNTTATARRRRLAARRGPPRRRDPQPEQPDRRRRPRPDAEPAVDYDIRGYADNGGVHSNSGVGNKTAYLISQGGTFNGQTITGIDVGDADPDQDRRALLRRRSVGSPRAATTPTSPTCSTRPARTSSTVASTASPRPTARTCTRPCSPPSCAPRRPTRRSRRTPRRPARPAVVPRVLFDSETGDPVGGSSPPAADVAAAADPLGQQRRLRTRVLELRGPGPIDGDQPVSPASSRRRAAGRAAELPVVPALAAAATTTETRLLRRRHRGGRQRRRRRRPARRLESRLGQRADRRRLRAPERRARSAFGRRQPRVGRQPGSTCRRTPASP